MKSVTLPERDAVDFGLRLREARERANLTQRAAARASGVGEKTISSFESYRRIDSLKVAQLHKLLTVYGMTEGEFYGERFRAEIIGEARAESRVDDLVLGLMDLCDERREKVVRAWRHLLDQARQAQKRGLRLVSGSERSLRSAR